MIAKTHKHVEIMSFYRGNPCQSKLSDCLRMEGYPGLRSSNAGKIPLNASN